jgi:carboxymethylenebutenolidase
MRFVALALLVACSSSSTTSSPPRPESHRPSDTGAVSEEKFKAMHELPTPGPVKRDGQTIDVNGNKAYLALPRGTGPFPAIVVIHEWWGLNPNIEHWADRLASAGWAALAIDLYGGVVATDRDTALATMKAVDETRASKVIADGLAFLATDPRIKAPTRAVIGWCFGGAWSLQTALAHPELDGAIIYYGQLETDPTKLAAIKARVLGVFGTKDEGIPQPTVDAFEAGLEKANVRAEIKRYDAEHGFANPSNPKYDQVSAGDAWKHVMIFLTKLRK